MKSRKEKKKVKYTTGKEIRAALHYFRFAIFLGCVMCLTVILQVFVFYFHVTGLFLYFSFYSHGVRTGAMSVRVKNC